MGDDPLTRELTAACTGEVVPDAAVAPLTTLRVGGVARVQVTAESDADLAAIGRACVDHGVSWLVLGRGSNFLLSDAGWPGVVVVLGRGFRGLEIADGRVTAGAAEPMPVVAVRTARAGLGGFAWAAGVPGSVGGAVRMNAGAHGGDIAGCLVSADLFRLRSQTRETWPAHTLGLRYRHSELPEDAIVVSATLRLPAADPDAAQAEIREIKQWRRDHQPINDPNCGSVFTNPPGDSAGRLIESVGGKDLRVGGARISPMHANFIVTAPDATAADVRALIRTVRQRVYDTHGVRLRPEVQMLGAFDDAGIDIDDHAGGEVATGTRTGQGGEPRS